MYADELLRQLEEAADDDGYNLRELEVTIENTNTMLTFEVDDVFVVDDGETLEFRIEISETIDYLIEHGHRD